MTPGTWYSKVAYISDLPDLGTYYDNDMYRGHGNILQYTVCVVCANSYSRRNRTHGSPLGWLWIAAQQYSSHINWHKVLYSNACCSYELVEAFAVLVPDTHPYQKVVTTYLIRLDLYSDAEKCRQLPSGTTRINSSSTNGSPTNSSLTTETAVRMMQ